jgi:hypothetical protein
MTKKTDAAPIDFQALKRALAGSDAENPVNCAVALFTDGTVSMAADRRKAPKVLARDLLKSALDLGFEKQRYFCGTAYMDEFPGTIRLALDRAPSALATKLRVALRGSGFGKVDITATGDDE